MMMTQSMQLAGFLMSVCHVVLLIQDHFFDATLIESILTAEMLKPSSPTLLGGGGESGSSSRQVQIMSVTMQILSPCFCLYVELVVRTHFFYKLGQH